MRFYHFPIVVEKEAEDEGHSADSPSLPGCFSNDQTIEEARRNMREAIQQHVAALLAGRALCPAHERCRGGGKSGDEGLDDDRGNAGEDEADHPFKDQQVRFDLREAAVVVGERLGGGARLLVGGACLLEGIRPSYDDRAHRLPPSTRHGQAII